MSLARTDGAACPTDFSSLNADALVAVWRYYYVWENRRRDKAAEAAGISPEERERLGMINAENDMTDVENVQCVSPPFLHILPPLTLFPFSFRYAV